MKEQQIRTWAKSMGEETDKTYQKPISEPDAIIEYMKWRAEDNNKSIDAMMRYLVLMGLMVVFVILALYLAGIIPHTEITKVCVVAETVKGIV